MSQQCAVCDESDELLHKCNHCHRTYCPKHTLPEKHDCIGLNQPGTSNEGIPDATKSISGNNTEVNKPDIDRISDGKPRSSQHRSDSGKTSPDPLSDDEVTTYGGGKGEFESSPDVAADGSLKSQSTTSTDESNSDRTVLQRIISTVKFWS